MNQALENGKRVVCGWEANGGFLVGSNVERNGQPLRSLPTRDAMLPILCTLFSALQKGLSVIDLFSALPKRFSRAALLKDFPRPISTRIIELFSPTDPRSESEAQAIRDLLSRFLTPANGFGVITGINYVDGVRVTFDNGEVIHIRPSGNADELRVYAVSDTQERSNQIAELAVAEPDGILRQMERSARA